MAALLGLNAIVGSGLPSGTNVAPPRLVLDPPKPAWTGLTIRDTPDTGTYAPNSDGTRGPAPEGGAYGPNADGTWGPTPDDSASAPSTTSTGDAAAAEAADPDSHKVEIIDSVTDWGMDTLAPVTADKRTELAGLFPGRSPSDDSPIPAPILDAGPLVVLRWFNRYQPAHFDLAGQILGVPDAAVLDSSVGLSDLPGLDPQGQYLTEVDAEDVLFGDKESNSNFFARVGEAPDDDGDDSSSSSSVDDPQNQKRQMGPIVKLIKLAARAIKNIARIGRGVVAETAISVFEKGMEAGARMSRVAVRGKSGMGQVFTKVRKAPYERLSPKGKLKRLNTQRKEYVQRIADSMEKERMAIEKEERVWRVKQLKKLSPEERGAWYDTQRALARGRRMATFKARNGITKNLNEIWKEDQRALFNKWLREGRPLERIWKPSDRLAKLGEKTGHKWSIKRMGELRAQDRQELARVERELTARKEIDELNSTPMNARDELYVERATLRSKQDVWRRFENRLETMSDDEWADDVLGPELRKALRKEDGDVEENFIKKYNDLDESQSLQQMMKSLKQDVPDKPISPPEPPPNTPMLGPDQMSYAELEDIDNVMMGGRKGVPYKYNPGQVQGSPVKRSSCLTCMAVAALDADDEE